MTMKCATYGGMPLAFMLGALTGAAVALLYAPASGAATRHKLAEDAARLRASSVEKYDHARDYVVGKVEHARDYVAGKVERGRASVQNRTEAVDAAVHAGTEAYRTAREQQ